MPAFSYRGAVLAVAVGNIAVLSSLYLTQPVLPRFAADFHVDAAVADLTVSLATLALAVALLVLGPLSDRVGKRRVMIVSSAALILPTIGIAFSPTFSLLLLLRVVQGVCSAGVGSIALAYVIQEFPADRVGSALGWVTLSLVAAAVMGRVGGGLIADAWGWRAMFLVFAVIDLVGVLLMLWLLPPERHFQPSGSVPESLRAIVGHLRSGNLLKVSAIGFLASFTLLAYFAQLSFYLESSPFHLSTGQIGLIYLVYVVGAFAPLAGALSSRIGRRGVIGAGLFLLGGGTLASLIPVLPAVLLATAIASLGLFSTHTADNAFVGDIARTHRGSATALYMFFYYTGGSVGVYVLGLAWDHWQWRGVAGGCATAAVLGLLLAMTLPHTTHETVPVQEPEVPL